MASTEALLITCLADGTYHVKETEGAGDPDAADDADEQPIDQSVKDPQDVIQLVQQFLQDCQGDMGDGSDDDSSDPTGAMPNPKSAWNAEAKMRDPSSGLRK